jgi:hypothetical protein
VKTVYVFPGSVSESILEYLAQAEVNLIGGSAPPASVQNRWVVSIQADLLDGVRDIWPDLASGNGGASIGTPLVLKDVNPNLLSPGRQRLVEETLANLVEGYIGTGVELSDNGSQ